MSDFKTEVALSISVLLIIALTEFGFAFLANHFNRNNKNYERMQKLLLVSLYKIAKSTIVLTFAFTPMGTEHIDILPFIAKVCIFLYGLYRKTKNISDLICLMLAPFCITLEEEILRKTFL